MTDLAVVLLLVGSVATLLLLIMGLKLHAFVSLILVSLVTAMVAGIPLAEVVETVEDGMGSTLADIAIIVGLGAMFGEVLRVTGAAERIARTLLDRFGESRSPWALAATGFVVSIPVFFDVALVLLVYLLYSVAQRGGRSLLFYAIPLLAGLSAAHSLVPPTPGPVAVAGIIGADLGWVIVFGLVAGIPAVVVGGVLFGKWIAARIEVGIPEAIAGAANGDGDTGGDGTGGGKDGDTKTEKDTRSPSFVLVLSIILVPLVLILLNTLGEVILDEEGLAARVLGLVGDPIVALIVAVLLAFYVLGVRLGHSRETIQKAADKALEPVGLILLVTGAGGVFGAVLEAAGLGETLENFFQATAIPPVLLGFLAAYVLRLSLGSATVASVTAAAIVAPALGGADLSAAGLGIVVTAIAAGATMTSHVNDSGFWLVSRYLGMSEGQTLRTWTVMQTLLGLVAIAVLLPLSFVF
jgi:gluconate transporter